jgi:3-hydroxybutyryl-CoA dehydrogenase
MIERLGIVGGGFMGSGIAESAARAGQAVKILEPTEATLDRARHMVAASVSRAVTGGKLSEAEGASLESRISYTTAMADLADSQLVIEAISEDQELKSAVFTSLSDVVGADVVLASNTSSIPIAQLAADVTRPERVIGLHFFSPVPVMKLVEIVVALDTDPDVVATAEAFVAALGKRAIRTKDRSGFIVNMLLVPYLMAAVRMYEEGFADREDIDAGMKLGCGHPMGPLALCDFIGLDVLYSVCDSLYEEFKEPGYAPPPLMKRMVASGRLGRKTGRGFYDYPRVKPAAAVAA